MHDSLDVPSQGVVDSDTENFEYPGADNAGYFNGGGGVAVRLLPVLVHAEQELRVLHGTRSSWRPHVQSVRCARHI